MNHLRQAWACRVEAAKPNTQVTYRVDYLNKGQSDAKVVAQALDGGKVVGTMSLHPRWEGREVLSVWDVYVEPKYQRQGIATGLLHAVHDAYPQHHIWHGGFASDEGQAFAENTPRGWNRVKGWDDSSYRKPKGVA